MISNTENDEIFNSVLRSLRLKTWLLTAILILVIAIFVKVFSL